MDKFKKKILIDLDGVLNTYDGNYDKNVIPPIKDGAKEFIEELYKSSELYMFTSRNLLLASKWLVENQIDKYFADVTNVKIPSFVCVDDRAINFKGDYETTLKEINDFKAYWK